MINLKRIYNNNHDDDIRILVDRLWPRGVSKKDAELDEWLKEIAPGNELRKWYSHDISKWEIFKTRYKDELSNKLELVEKILEYERNYDSVTLLYAAKDNDHNNAIVLKEYLEEHRNG